MNLRLIKFLLVALILPVNLWAGGIVTNTNQSASFIRKPVQDAVINATGTYYNPAGLAFLEDGFHFSISNQSILQTRKIKSTFPGLANNDFEGNVTAPLFPTVYAVYKTGPLAVSFGLNPIGGGGSANFEEGLPSLNEPFATFGTTFSAQSGIPTSYSVDAAFDGSSLNWGFQINGSYALNEVFSVSAGARFISAKNTYNGYIRNVRINPMHPLNPNGAGNMVEAPLFFNTLSGAATAAGAGLQPLIDQSVGGLTLAQLQTLELISPQQAAEIAGGLGNNYSETMTVEQIQGAYGALAAQMSGLADFTQNEFRDRALDASQSGWGIAPVFGINVRFSDELNMAVKYEHKASITMKNSTTIDDVGMYPDGEEVRNDMPSMIAAGINYKPTPALSLSAGMHYYFDKNADYGKALPNDRIIDNNFIELGFGAEYFLNNGFSISTGYLRTQTGVNDQYHSDLSHSLNTNSIGIGGSYRINRNTTVNIGFMNTMYEAYEKDFLNGAYSETYDRHAMTFAVGFDFKF